MSFTGWSARLPRSLPPPRRALLPRVLWLLTAVLVLGLGLALAWVWLRPFSVTIDPSHLELVAGQEPLSVWLRLHGLKPVAPVEISWPEQPPDLVIEKSGPPDGDLRALRIAGDLNAPPSAKPRTLLVTVRAGTKRTTLAIPYTIRPPALVPLPDGFVPAAGARLTRVNNQVYPDHIVRRLSDHLSATFVLVSGQAGRVALPPFYIMENKVWNDLFDVYLKARPDTTRELAQRQARHRQGHEHDDGSWPVFQVTAIEAQQFAAWFVHGAGLRGDLPTREQWDKAAGYYDRDSPAHDERGPFLRGWSPGAAGQIALHQHTPLPVGQASLDISRFGLRDMAGNGQEWTRPPDDLRDQVILRGRRFDDFDEPDPLTYDDIAAEPALSEFRDKPQSYVGFRVVIEGAGTAARR